MKNHYVAKAVSFITAATMVGISLMPLTAGAQSSNYVFSLKWGSFCNISSLSGCVDPDGVNPLQVGDGQFNSPGGIGVDSAGNVYVADSNKRVQKFDLNGNFLLKWSGQATIGFIPAFNAPLGIAFNSIGNVYVVDSQGGFPAGRVQVFTNTGTHQTDFGAGGAGDGQFSNPSGIGIDASNNIYVVDASNNRVQKWNSSHAFLGWAGHCTGGSNCDTLNQRSIGFSCTSATCSGHAAGAGDGQFSFPISIAFGSTGEIYILDSGNQRVQVFDGSGAFLRKFGSPGSLSIPEDGKFSSTPTGLALDNEDNVFVGEIGPFNRILRFDSTGNFLGWAGKCVSGSNCDLSGPTPAEVSKGFLCTAATCMTATGLNNDDNGDGQLSAPRDLAFNLSKSRLYVVDRSNQRIQAFDQVPLNSLCVQRALDDLGVTQAELGADFAELVNACDVTQTTIFSEDIETTPGVIQGNVDMATPDDLLIVKSGTLVDGQIRGDGAQTVMIGSNVTIDSHLKDLDRVIFAGTGIFIGGHIKHNIKELALLDNSSGTIDGELLVGKLEMGQNAILTVTNKITINTSWLLETGSVLNGGSSLNCGAGSTGTDNGTVNVSGKNNCAPGLAVRALNNSNSGSLATYLPLLALAALGLAIYVRPRRA